MPITFRGALVFAALLLLVVFVLGFQASAQSFGTVQGTVTDPTNAVIPGATVEIQNPVSGFTRSAVTDGSGKFSIPNVPFNPYHLTVTGKGFSSFSQDVDVRSVVPVTVNPTLKITGASETVTVEASGADLIETDPTFHTDVDRNLFSKMPLESTSSDVSSLVTLSTPGIAADSNGLFHGLGDHAENSFSVDGQPITDQQSKVFSNQIPLDSIQSLEVISGAPPAEFGDKTSIVINVATRSGQGLTTPKGSVTTSYGSFGTSNFDFNLGYGGQNWGNFIALSGLNTSRFLDPPEFEAIHDKGNQQNAFNRFDLQLSDKDAIHLNLGFTRSWFQTPSSFDTLNLGVADPVLGNPVGPQDQHSQIRTFNISPSWTHLLNANTVFTLGAYVRHDQYNYYPSANPFADSGPLQQETFSQVRRLTNAGVRSDISYTKNGHNLKAGITYQHFFLSEHDNFGIVDPTLNAPCVNPAGSFVPGFTDPAQCAGAGLIPNNGSNPAITTAPFQPFLGCFDLTRPNPASGDDCPGRATIFPFVGSTDIKETALYVQDAISRGNWTVNLGLRADFYNGFSSHKELEPRLGVAYNIKQTGTVLRASYARVLETPFNENLIISATGCNFNVIAALVPCVPATFSPGWRNEFHAGLEQAFGKYLVFSGEYITKYTHNAYDFSVLAATPLTFPIEWHNSKIPGWAGRVSVPNYHGFTALYVFSSVTARYFPPQIGGLGVTVGQNGLPFRIDHDEAFNQTLHLQYQIGKRGPWLGWNWRYDSGLVAGAVPFAIDSTTPVDLTGLTADQQIAAGLFCGNQVPTLTAPLTTCAPSLYGSRRVSLPAPGTENDDHNPPRIASRSLFDAAIGHDNLFKADRYKVGLRFTVINLTDKEALYNFLSTFSGTHFVTPRSYSAALSFNF